MERQTEKLASFESLREWEWRVEFLGVPSVLTGTAVRINFKIIDFQSMKGDRVGKQAEMY